MTINWNEVWSYEFWFQIDHSRLHSSDYWILYAGIALTALAILLFLYRLMVKNKFIKQVAGRIAKIFITIGLLEILWFGIRFENGLALGTKFTAVLIAVVGLVWMYWPIKYLFTRYKTDMEIASREVTREKYLNYNKK